MNFTYQNFVRILAYQHKSNQGVIKLLMIIEFVQNIALCFPKHGWGQYQFTDNMLRSIQQVTNYTLFQHQFTANQLLDTFISCIALIYFLVVGLCLFKLKQQRLSQIVNLTLNIAMKVFKFPLLTIYINYFYSYTFKPIWTTLTIISCGIFLVISILTLYFQRDISINLSRKYYPLNNYYSPVQFIIYLFDIFRIMIFVLLTTKAGFIFMLIINFFNFTLKLYININQQNDPDKFQQGLLLSYLAFTALLISTWSINLDENNLFNLLLYLTTLCFNIFQQIQFQNFYNSSNLIHQVQQHIQSKLEYFFLKIINNQDDTFYINYIRNMLDMDILQKEFSLTEENVLLQYDYLVKNQSFYQALYLLNKFESQSLRLSLFYKSLSMVYKQSIQSDIKLINKSTQMIQTLNRDIILESEYQFRFKTILIKQINFYDRITQESKSMYEVEKIIQVISQNIRSTRNWLKRNNILGDETNFTFIKIQMNFYYFVMQHNVQAMKLKKKLQLIQNKDQKTVEAIQLMKSKAIVLTLSLIKHKGIILNVNKSSLQFLGFFSADYKLEFIDQLLPEPIQPFHQLFLERYLRKNELSQNYSQKQLEVLQLQENGTLQCLEINIAISNDHTDFVLIALLKKIHQHKGYIIFDTTGKIISVNDQIQGLEEIYQQMKTYNYIQYFTPDIFYILNNHEFLQEKEISFVQRTFVNRIDRQFRQFIQSQNKTVTQVMPYTFEYISSDRSEKYSLLHHKNNYSERDLLIFDITDQQYQDKLMEIINSNISEKDKILKYKVVLSKIVYDDQILQYQMELIFLEARIDVEEENENLDDKLPKFKQLKATSCNDVSVVSSEQRASEILHEILQSKFKNSLFLTIILYQIIIMLLVLLFFIIQVLQVQLDFTSKSTYFSYINVPTQLNQFVTNIFNYGFNLQIYQQINSSQYLKNQFQKNKEYQLIQFRESFNNLQYNLIQIEEKGYGFDYTIQMQQITLNLTKFTPFIELIKDNLIIILNYQINSREFAESILFFRQNLISAYNVAVKLSNTFNLLLQNYTTDLTSKWKYIISFYIVLCFFPFLFMIVKWHVLEKKHRTLIQIMTRVTQEQAFKQLEAKKAHIQYIEDDKIRMTQSFHTHRSQIQVISTSNNITQHLRSKESQYVYELIKSKKINIFTKILLSFTFFLMITGLAFFGYLQISISDTAYIPVQTLMQTFTNFEISLNTLVSMSTVMKGQSFFIQEFSDVDSNIIGNVSNLFTDDQLPKYFSNISLTYSKKIIKIFQSIILSEQIDEGQKDTLYSLYKGDFCQFIADELPFCNVNISANDFSQQFGQYYDYDNNSEVLRIGIMGYVSRLSSLLKNNFNSEMSTATYLQNITTEIFYTQDYNTLITQYSFNISHGFQLFSETVNSIAIDLIGQTKNNLVIYYVTFSLIFAAVFSIASIVQIKMAINRYLNLLLALVTLSEELLNDKTNLTLLKRLKA